MVKYFLNTRKGPGKGTDKGSSETGPGEQRAGRHGPYSRQFVGKGHSSGKGSTPSGKGPSNSSASSGSEHEGPGKGMKGGLGVQFVCTACGSENIFLGGRWTGMCEGCHPTRRPLFPDE